MSARDIVVLVLVAVVLGGVSIMSIISASRMHENAQKLNAPYLAAAYTPNTPEQHAVVDNVVTCMIQYGKIDPGHTPAHEFDPTPLGHMPEPRRTAAVANLRQRLEGMCVAYGFQAVQAGRSVGALTPQQFAQAAAGVGMDVAAAQAILEKGRR